MRFSVILPIQLSFFATRRILAERKRLQTAQDLFISAVEPTINNQKRLFVAKRKQKKIRWRRNPIVVKFTKCSKKRCGEFNLLPKSLAANSRDWDRIYHNGHSDNSRSRITFLTQPRLFRKQL